MNCTRSRELLAVWVGEDLPAAVADDLRAHLTDCAECRECHSRLEGNRGLLRSLRHEVVTTAALTEMRRNLFRRLEGRRKLGWRVQFERFLFGEFRKPRYAMLCLVLLGIISATVFTQWRPASANRDGILALNANSNTLRLSDNYRGWVLVGTSAEFAHSGRTGVPQNVYINPEAYRTYRATGKFPEGTVLVLESAGGDNAPLVSPPVSPVVASVKNRQLSGGWGFFQFTDAGPQKTMDAQALPETAGCLACHRNQGATDHVFTQFYPVLRSASGVL